MYRSLMLKNFKVDLLKRVRSEKGFWDYVAAIAIGLVIVAFIALPSLRTFATGVFTKITSWWTTIAPSVFPTS